LVTRHHMDTYGIRLTIGIPMDTHRITVDLPLKELGAGATVEPDRRIDATAPRIAREGVFGSRSRMVAEMAADSPASLYRTF
jgi:hypothetical protein